MTTTINADTSTGGAVISGDASGVLGLQAAGSTQVTINGSGVVLANPLPVGSGGTGATSLSGITAGSATNLAGGSAGTVPYQSAAGTTAMLAAGTSGQVLTSSGAGAPSWTTPSAGALVLLSTQTVSSAVTYVTFSNVFNSTYNDYLIIFEAVAHNNSYPYTEGVFGMQIEKAGSFRTSGYNGLYGNVWGSSISSSSSSGSVTVSTRQDSNSIAGTVYCFGMNQTEYLKQKFLGYTQALGVRASWFEQQQNDGPVTGIRFLAEDTSTTISQGSFYVYGIAKS